MDFAPETLFFVIFAAIVGYFAYQVIRHGGFKAAMFGARIEHTVGEVIGEKKGPMNVALKVHALRRNESERLIGIELVAKKLRQLPNDAYNPFRQPSPAAGISSPECNTRALSHITARSTRTRADVLPSARAAGRAPVTGNVRL